MAEASSEIWRGVAAQNSGARPRIGAHADAQNHRAQHGEQHDHADQREQKRFREVEYRPAG